MFPSVSYGVKNYIDFLKIRLRCRKVVIQGCGIVPKTNSFYFKLFLKQVHYCSVRDDVSAEYVRTLKKSVINCGDLYWGNDNHFSSSVDNNKCLICLANPFSDNELRTPHFKERYNQFLNTVCEVIKHIKQKGFTIEYLPFYRGSDDKLINNIQEKLQTNDKVLVRHQDYELDSIDYLFGQYQIGFCMRFHSILLAVKNRLPIVAINYDYKSESLLAESGLEKYGVHFGIRKGQFFNEESDIDSSRINQALGYALNDAAEFKMKADLFFKKKHESVIRNYESIFKDAE